MCSAQQVQTTFADEQIRSYTFERLLNEQGYLIYTATGYSMMPLLRQCKDIIEIRPLTRRAKKYDVILYKRRNSYVLHRVLKVCHDGKYIIAGDHNTFKEYDVTDEMILGVMVKFIRDGKTINPNNIWYKFYYHIWVDFYPIRVYILKGKAKIRRIGGKIKRKIKCC